MLKQKIRSRRGEYYMENIGGIEEKPFAVIEGCINALFLVLPFWLVVFLVVYWNLF